MKWFHRLFAAVAVAMAAVACTLDPLAESESGGEPEDVTFDVGIKDVLTKADNTPLDNAGGTFQLYVAAFDKADGSLAAASLVGGEGYQPVAVLTDGKASVKLRLSRKREYRVVFFAMKEGAYTPFFGNNNSARIGISQKNLANDASMDAFYAGVDVSAAKTSYDITLKRPFAQLNVLVPGDNVPDGQTTFKSTMTVKMPIHFDLFSGKAGTTEAEVTFTANAIAAAPFGNYAQTHKWVGMNYVIVPESGKVEVTSFREDGMEAAIAPGEVPVKVNSRTNLVGNLYGTDLDFSITVVVNPDFDSAEEYPMEGDTPAPQPQGGDFVRLTDVSALQDGDEFIIVYEDESVAMGPASDNGNFRQAVDVTIADDTISDPDAMVQVVTLEASGEEDWWYLAVDGGYLAAQEAANNYLVTVMEKSDYALWTIEIDDDGTWLYTAEGDRCMLCYNTNSPRFSCYDFYNPQEPVSLFVRSGADNSTAILEHKELGCYLPDHTWAYTAGTDQYVREYDGTALDFVLLKPADKEQMVLSGCTGTMQAGDAVTVTLDWKKGTSRVLAESYAMRVIKIDGKTVWLADRKGNGFVIKK